MMKVRRAVCGAVALTALVAGAGCYGPFKLTCKLHEWNGRATENRWANEAIFFVLAGVGVYSLCAFADAVVLNSIEWWSGRNPMDHGSTEKKKAEAPGRFVAGDEEVAVSLAPEGDAVVVERFRAGAPAGNVRIERQGDSAVAKDAGGATLYTARPAPDGNLVVSDPSGTPVAFYSAAEIRSRLGTAR